LNKKFKRVFESQRRGILFNDKVLRDDFSVCTDDRFDEVDQATTDVEQSMRMRLCNREILYLKKVDEALKRIDEGTYGICKVTGEAISVERLEEVPIAKYSVKGKELLERRRRQGG